jgi:hypothetical protein
LDDGAKQQLAVFARDTGNSIVQGMRYCFLLCVDLIHCEAMIDDLHLAKQVKATGESTSNFALYLISPEVLDLEIYNYYSDILKIPTIVQKKYQICQLEIPNFDPICLKIPEVNFVLKILTLI